MSDRIMARLAAKEFADLFVEFKHDCHSPRDISGLFRKVQTRYKCYCGGDYDFAASEMRVDFILWQLAVIPLPEDSLWERANSPYYGKQHSDFKRVEDLQEGEMFRWEGSGGLAIVKQTTSRKLTYCSVSDDLAIGEPLTTPYKDYWYWRVLTAPTILCLV